MRISDWSSDVCSSDLILNISYSKLLSHITANRGLPQRFEQQRVSLAARSQAGCSTMAAPRSARSFVLPLHFGSDPLCIAANRRSMRWNTTMGVWMPGPAFDEFGGGDGGDSGGQQLEGVVSVGKRTG